MASAPIPIEDIFHCIEVVHRKNLITSDAQHPGNRLWRKPEKGWPIPETEIKIAGLLVIALQACFPTCDIHWEDHGVAGRLDIAIQERVFDPPGHQIQHAVLELKVLRARTSTGTSVSQKVNEVAVSEGLEQAASYQEEIGAIVSALCCFDMRENFTGQDCFAGIRELARKMGVKLAAWHLFWTSASYRHHNATHPKSAVSTNSMEAAR
jgi:hypothetical protein